MARRFKQPWGHPVLRPDRLDQPLRAKKPEVIGVCFTGDLFHDAVDTRFIGRVFEVMRECPQHLFLLLTKRAFYMLLFVRGWMGQYDTVTPEGKPVGQGWPLPNVWLGTTAWDQPSWDRNVALLRDTPAAHRWVSYEPALGPVENPDLTGIDWVVAGCESGSGARKAPCKWLRDMQTACREAGIPCYVKQASGEKGEPKVIHFPPLIENLPAEIAALLNLPEGAEVERRGRS
jgi:protein gp37